MDRRRFLLTSLAGALAAPLAADAQQAKLVRIGFLSGNPASDTEETFDAFRMKLRTLGYAEGRNLVVESRHAESRYERLPQLVAELVRLRVDVIFAYGTPGSLAAKNATTTIPIVFAGVADPLEIGLVATVSTPGANVTGVMSNSPELSAKRVSLLKEAVVRPEKRLPWVSVPGSPQVVQVVRKSPGSIAEVAGGDDVIAIQRATSLVAGGVHGHAFRYAATHEVCGRPYDIGRARASRARQLPCTPRPSDDARCQRACRRCERRTGSRALAPANAHR